MRSTRILFSVFAGLLAGTATFAAPEAAAGNAKVEICHIPPGNPANFHTITISENAVPAHLAHGDLAGPCDAACATLCDDGDACTIDDSADCEQQGCPATREQVDCNDQNACTADSCDPLTQCVNEPLVGAACDDGDLCSGPDVCTADGTCAGPANEGCCLSDADCSSNLCLAASCNPETHRCGSAPVICVPPDACSVSKCAPDTGECVDFPKCRPGREVCVPDTGECLTCVLQHSPETLCSDNDRDGSIDAADSDCSGGGGGGGGCTPTVPRCDGRDNDCDSLVDEADECSGPK
jgi:hypothetical protein